MKIRSLTLQGIGPFAGLHTVDFSVFDQSGLFLLEGPTGSGKSSIIDALMFALYGRVSGSLDQADQRLRSTYCADDQASSVSLLFETASGIYEVVRTPGYQPGNRKTPKPATARLDRVTVSDDGTVTSREGVAVKKNEVEEAVLALVGLDANQFRQTVVLPQGEFSAFLMARSEERRKILQDIFGTALYQEMQAYLQQEARDARERIRTAQSRTEGRLDSLLKALGDDLGDDLGEPIVQMLSDDGQLLPLELVEVDSLRASFDAAGEEMVKRLEQLGRGVAEAQERAEASRTRLIAAERAEESIGRRRALQKALTDLEQERPMIGEAHERLAAARRASEPLRRHEAWQAIAGEESQAKSIARSLAESLEETLGGDAGRAIEALDVEALDSRDLAGVLRDIAQQRGGLQELLAQEESATKLADEIGLLQAQHDTLTRLQQDQITKTRLLEVELGKARAILDDGRQLETDEKNLEIARSAVELASKIVGAELAHSDAVESARQAGREETDLRSRWLADSAGAIAIGLKPGEPCPVCGSEHHPRPAVPSEDTVSLEAVTRAADLRRKADKALQEAGGVLLQLRTQKELLGEVPAYDDGDLELLGFKLVQRRAEYDQSKAIAERVDKDIADLSERNQERELDIVRMAANLTDAKARLARTRETIGARSHPFATIHDKATALDLIHRRVSRLAEAKRSLKTAAEGAQRALEAFEESARVAGYPAGAEGRSQVASDALSESETQSLVDLVSTHQARFAEVKKQLEGMQRDREIEARAAALPRLRLAHDADQKVTEESQRALADWSAYTRTLKQHFDEATALIDRWQREIEQAAPVIRLASLANASGSDNLHKTPLASYVLMRRLDEVLEATNPRLKEFSNHHYELVRQAEGRDGNRKTGLGLEILDNETGRRRPPGTLSGGEVFYTSLALALGLAEIVTAEAGGFDLGTVFIDEGFGSLDGETLDIVMKHLEELRSGGRTVGVVSHVTEMQTRIAEGIRVCRLGPGKGSTLAMRC